MSEHVTFVRRIGLTGLTRIIVALKGLILLPILTKTLGASNYGMWALILTTIALLEPFLQLGLGTSIVRYLPSKNKSEIVQGISTALSAVLFIGSIGILLIFTLSDTLAITIFKDESAGVMIRVASLLILLNSLVAISLNSFRIFGQIKKESLVLLFTNLLEVCLIGFFVLSGYGLLGALISLLVTKFICFMIILYLIISYAGFQYPNFSLLYPYIKFGSPLIVVAIFEIALQSSDRYIIGYYLGMQQVGVYSAAYAIGGMISVISVFIMRILYPTIFDLYDKGRINKVKLYLSYSWKYMLMLFIPSIFGLNVLSKPLLINLTTSEFVVDGSYVVSIIAISMLFNGIYGLYGGVIRLQKNTRILMAATIISILINTLLNIIFVPIYGIIFAAISTLVSYIICVIVVSQKANVRYDKDYIFVAKCIISSIVMALIIWIINPIEITYILLSIIFGVMIYFSTLILLKGFNENEIGIFCDVVGVKRF